MLMKNNDIKKLALFPVLLLIATPLQAASDYYCWNNQDGVYECGNYVPAQYSQKGYWKRLKNGGWKEVDPAPTAGEIAEQEKQQEEERRKEEQREEDNALLKLFSTERDIDTSREAILYSIAAQLRPIESTLNILKENLKDLDKSKKRSENNLNVSDSQRDTIQRDIDRVTKRIQDNQKQLQNKRLEEEKINQKYNGYLERFREIMSRRGGSTE